MVTFPLTQGGVEVHVNGRCVGAIQPQEGFFTSPTLLREFATISAPDLRKIADKAEEMKTPRPTD